MRGRLGENSQHIPINHSFSFLGSISEKQYLKMIKRIKNSKFTRR